MKKPDITNLRAEHTGMGICIMWNGQGYRHHFWLNDYQIADRKSTRLNSSH